MKLRDNSPDLVLLVGDYITGIRRIKNVDSHRRSIIKTFKSLDPILEQLFLEIMITTQVEKNGLKNLSGLVLTY